MTEVANDIIIIIIMYIYHALINTLSAHMVPVNLYTIFCTHIEHNPTKTIYMRYYMETLTHTHIHTHTYVDCMYFLLGLLSTLVNARQ